MYGWIIRNDKVIIQGVQCSRCGYTVEGKNFISKSLWSTDIKFLNQAKYLNALMYDFRKKSNDWITSVNFISNQSDIALLSICMGIYFCIWIRRRFQIF